MLTVPVRRRVLITSTGIFTSEAPVSRTKSSVSLPLISTGTVYTPPWLFSGIRSGETLRADGEGGTLSVSGIDDIPEIFPGAPSSESSCTLNRPRSVAPTMYCIAWAWLLGTPRPLPYIHARLSCAAASPCSAARRYHRTASASFWGTCCPRSYIHPRRFCISASCSAAFRYHFERLIRILRYTIALSVHVAQMKLGHRMLLGGRLPIPIQRLIIVLHYAFAIGVHVT